MLYYAINFVEGQKNTIIKKKQDQGPLFPINTLSHYENLPMQYIEIFFFKKQKLKISLEQKN